MDISIIIVNYNVAYFLEQCLHSVNKATKHLKVETIVVDNQSADDSVNMVKQSFPSVKLIANDQNVGFSKANNQGIKIAQGKYILLLNPDTLLQEDSLTKPFEFMQQNDGCGGLGVKMIDGNGQFLPESKRGLPTPKVAFYKIFGLSKLFPKSKKFGQYHLSFLNKNETHEVDVLSGAYMFLRKQTLDKIGLLDESFFMYGEDIDLSYRIILGGYKNVYFPETTIIHYKGESTKKSSINYVFVFYRAMIIFAKKHFKSGSAITFSTIINAAIYARAGLAIFNRLITNTVAPILDFLLIIACLFGFTNWYSAYSGIIYSPRLVFYGLIFYALTWVISIFLNGGYEKPFKLSKLLIGTLIGTAIILLIYALLPETYRFSRALIISGFGIVLLSGITIRTILSIFNIANSKWYKRNSKRQLIIGTDSEVKRVKELLDQTGLKTDFFAFVHPTKQPINAERYLGSIQNLTEIISVFKINEVIFCAKDLASEKIIETMSSPGLGSINFKIAPPESLFVIGSNSINTTGEYYSIMNLKNIRSASNVRNKRILDIMIAITFIVISPILMFIQSSPIQFLINCFKVFIGTISWVGYNTNNKEHALLPQIKKGVIYTSDTLKTDNASHNILYKLNAIYAKDYSLFSDLNLIFKRIKNLDRKT